MANGGLQDPRDRRFLERGTDESMSRGYYHRDEHGGSAEGERNERPVGFAGRGPRSYRRPDRTIWEEVNEFMTHDHELDASDIEVKVEGGEVTLEGTVPDRYSKRLAEILASGVRGVSDVHNRLRLKAH